MQNSIDIYLQLLRRGLTPQERLTPNPSFAGMEVENVVELAMRQGTGPLVMDQLLSMDSSQCTMHDELRMWMKQVCMQNMMRQEQMKQYLVQGWGALVRAGVQPVLLKGFSLARWYEKPYLRSWGDIDIYVGQKAYHKACEVLRKQFPEAEHPDEEYEHYKHYNFDFSNTVIETHRVSMVFTHPREDKVYQQLEEDILQWNNCEKIKVADIEVAVPEATFELFFTFIHAWEHFISQSATAKQLVDIAQLLHHRQDVIDRPRLQRYIQMFYLMDVWQIMGSVVVNQLGLPKEEFPFYRDGARKRGDKYIDLLLNGQRRSETDVSDNSYPYLIRKMVTLSSRLRTIRWIWRVSPGYAMHHLGAVVCRGVVRLWERK